MEAKLNSRLLLGIFLVALFTLMLNDFYLKQNFHNDFTGKLSDFAGLLIFPWFWSLIFYKSAKWIYTSTTLLFVFWKLEYSSAIIDLINKNLGFSMGRVIDPTDLIAMSVLPISFIFFKSSMKLAPKIGHFLKYGISGVAFFATSQPSIFL